MQEVRQAAEFLELPQLIVLLSNTQSNESFMNEETILHYTTVSFEYLTQIQHNFNLYSQCMKQNLEKNCIDNGMFADINFDLDDGRMRAHRAILVGRCEVMLGTLNKMLKFFPQTIIFDCKISYDENISHLFLLFTEGTIIFFR